MHIKRPGIYQIINEVNGKSYVGSSIDINSRWRQWRSQVKKNTLRYRSPLVQAFQKYGIDNFTFIILEQCEPTKEALEKLEQHYIDTLKPEYNILPRAYSPVGHKLTDEQREKLRASYTDARREKISKAAKAYMSTPEAKQKYIRLRQGKTYEQIFGEKRAANLKAKLSELRLKNPVEFSEQALAKMCASGFQKGHEPPHKGVPLSDETRKKLSQSIKKAYAADSSIRRRISEKVKLHHSDSEFKEKMRVKAKRMWAERRQFLVELFQEVGKRPERRKQLSEIGKRRHADNPDHQKHITALARLTNLGKPCSEQRRRNISEGQRNSKKQKAWAEARRGVARSEQVKDKISQGQRTSEKCKAYHERRTGKMRSDNSSGHYGVFFDKARNKWAVKIRDKYCGRYVTIDEAIAKARSVMSELGLPIL